VEESIEILDSMPREWWAEEMNLTIDRLGCLALLGLLDLALRHPQMPTTSSKAGKQIGCHILERMLEDGLELPEAVEAVYRETFDM
jgi:hypothetical protein